MKTSLVAIIVAGLAAGLADATPASSLNKRRVEKKRDARNVLQTTQPPSPAAQDPAESKKSAAAISPQKPSAPAAQTPAAAAAAPTGPTDPSELSRGGKPPSRRFFSRLRSDASRDQTKAMRLATKPAQSSAQIGQPNELIYRRSWGPRAHRRPR